MGGYLSNETSIEEMNTITKKRYYVRYGKFFLFLIFVSLIFDIISIMNFIEGHRIWLLFFVLSLSPAILLASEVKFMTVINSLKCLSNDYAICPCCKKSIQTVYNWTCDYCHSEQGLEISIFKACRKCKRELEFFTCEHCGEESKINAN